jgi:hypothetical protein
MRSSSLASLVRSDPRLVLTKANWDMANQGADYPGAVCAIDQLIDHSVCDVQTGMIRCPCFAHLLVPCQTEVNLGISSIGLVASNKVVT